MCVITIRYFYHEKKSSYFFFENFASNKKNNRILTNVPGTSSLELAVIEFSEILLSVQREIFWASGIIDTMCQSENGHSNRKYI